MKIFPFIHFINSLLHIFSLSYLIGSPTFLVILALKEKFNREEFLKVINKYIYFSSFFYLLFFITNLNFLLIDNTFSYFFKKNPYVKILIEVYVPFVIGTILMSLHLYSKTSKLLKVKLPILIQKEWRKIQIDLVVIVEFFLVIIIIEALIFYLIYIIP
uniref:Uncharacterized protein n=1 Tax=Dictyoglomus thermophilum TaxID=14 RepID=A0A7C3RWK3_DICTH